EERPAQPADARAALLPARPHQARAQPGQLQGRNEAEGGRGRARARDRVRGAERPHGSPRRQPRQPRGALRRQGRLFAGLALDGEGARGRPGRGEAEEELPGDPLEELTWASTTASTARTARPRARPATPSTHFRASSPKSPSAG